MKCEQSTMKFSTLDEKSSTEARHTWPDGPPRDLAVRLADSLQYESCGPQDLWDEIGDWLTINRVVPPTIPHMHLVTSESVPSGSRKFLPRTQQGSAFQVSRLVYASKHRGVSSELLNKIMQTSRANNDRDDITGALIVDETQFLQILEGSRSSVSSCFGRIMHDNHHHDIQVITCGDVTHRLFQDWSMHLIEVSQVKQEIMSAFCVKGRLNPARMSEFAIEDLCRTLARGNWQKDAA